MAPGAKAASCQATVQRITNLSTKAQWEVSDFSGLLQDMQQRGAERTFCRDAERAEAKYYKLLRLTNEFIGTCDRLAFDCRNENVPTSFIQACKAVPGQRDTLTSAFKSVSRDKQRLCR
ncbi:MAG: hypothetical protein AAF221_11605 [Pseudomonadota bacterium]